MESNPYEAPKEAETLTRPRQYGMELLIRAIEVTTVIVSCAVAGYLFGRYPDAPLWAAVYGVGIYFIARLIWKLFGRR